MSELSWVIIGLVVGLVVGGVTAWLIARSSRVEVPSTRKLKEENERFREEVNAHFVHTAELINELTDSYKKVFDHLSDGAERLVDKEAVRERMPQVGQQEVRLRHIGAPAQARPGQDSSAAKLKTAAERKSVPAGEKPRPAGSDPQKRRP